MWRGDDVRPVKELNLIFTSAIGQLKLCGAGQQIVEDQMNW